MNIFMKVLFVYSSGLPVAILVICLKLNKSDQFRKDTEEGMREVMQAMNSSNARMAFKILFTYETLTWPSWVLSDIKTMCGHLRHRK